MHQLRRLGARLPRGTQRSRHPLPRLQRPALLPGNCLALNTRRCQRKRTTAKRPKGGLIISNTNRRLEQELGTLYSENGRPGIPIRLMAGLCYPSHAFKTSNEATVRCWLENPYHQYFCGQEYFCHELPIDPSSLCRFRKRINEKGSKLILQVTVQVG
ncbi:MAG: transposase [Desulfobulbus sp.]